MQTLFLILIVCLSQFAVHTNCFSAELTSNVLATSSSITKNDDQLVHSPIDLITPKRIDIMAKYIYAKHREWATTSKFGTDIYYHHLRVWNGFKEFNPPKQGFREFLYHFHTTLDSIKKEGYLPECSIIKIDNQGNIRIGAHRLTSCLLYNKPIYSVKAAHACPDWSLKFFERKGLEEKYLDAMAMQYCMLKPTTYILIVYPTTMENVVKIENIIKQYASVVYKKSIFFTESGGLNVILHAHDGEIFLYDKGNISQKARNRAKVCFRSDMISENPTNIYLLEINNDNTVRKFREHVRSIRKVDNYSVYITDTHNKTIMLAKAFFNKNSIHCLNYRKNIDLPHVESYFEKYKNWVKSTQQDDEWFAVDGEGVLAIYGLRDCSDWNYLHFKDGVGSTDAVKIIGYNKELKYHNIDKDTLLFDPDYHFYYKGVKFCSLSVVRNMKILKNTAQDICDIEFVDEVLH